MKAENPNLPGENFNPSWKKVRWVLFAASFVFLAFLGYFWQFFAVVLNFDTPLVGEIGRLMIYSGHPVVAFIIGPAFFLILLAFLATSVKAMPKIPISLVIFCLGLLLSFFGFPLKAIRPAAVYLMIAGSLLVFLESWCRQELSPGSRLFSLAALCTCMIYLAFIYVEGIERIFGFVVMPG